jgi:hypothetical protein
VATAAAHGAPEGLSVVRVIITVLPASPAAGVYVNVNGEVPDEAGLTEPRPFDVIVTVVALMNVLPLTVTGAVPQVLPFMLPGIINGPFAHPHDTGKMLPVVVHPEVFLTVIAWLPFATPVNVIPV